MRTSAVVWDIETVPDLKGFAAANGLDGKSDDDIRAALGERFPKHIYHSIICIGALVSHEEDGHWVVDALGAPHIGERSERALISSFVDRIAALTPQLVTFNGRQKRTSGTRWASEGAVARREVDLVAAWSVDRLGRSLTDLLEVLLSLRAGAPTDGVPLGSRLCQPCATPTTHESLKN